MITTPFFVNNYRHHDGTTLTAENPAKTRLESERNRSGIGKLNCRIRVTRLKGYPDESDRA